MNLSNKICESRRVNNEYQNYLGWSILLQCHVIKILRTEHYSLITINFLRTNFFICFLCKLDVLFLVLWPNLIVPILLRSGMRLHFAVYLDRSPAFVTFWWYHYIKRKLNFLNVFQIVPNKPYINFLWYHEKNANLFCWNHEKIWHYNDIIRT